MQYRRNDLNLVRGTFRVRGDTLEFVGVEEELVHRIEFSAMRSRRSTSSTT